MAARRLALLAALGPAFTLLGGCRDTFWSPDGRSLAVSHQGTVRILTLEGPAWVPVAAGREGESWTGAPAWSAGGSRLLFFRARDLKEGGTPVFSLEAFDTRARAVTVLADRLPVAGIPSGEAAEGQAEWSFHASPEPGGDRVAVSFRVSASEDEHAVFVAALDGGLRRVSRDGANHFWPSWGPNRAGIAVYQKETMGGGEDRVHVAILDPATGATRQVWTCPGGWFHGLPPVWSPDGTLLAVASGQDAENGRPERARLQILDARTGAQRQSLDVNGSVLGISLSADLRVAGCLEAVAGTPERHQLLIRPLEGGPAAGMGVLQLPDAAADPGVPVLSPDGRRFAALYRSDERPPFVRVLGPGSEEQRIPLPR